MEIERAPDEPGLPRRRMSSAARKLGLVLHVTSSVGWMGAVITFLVLSIAGLSSSDATLIRSAYIAMNLVGEFAIVPLSALALLTGLVQALGTHWGLTRYYWVLTKLALTLGAATLLLIHQYSAVSGAAQRVAISSPPDVGRLGTQLIFDSALAVLVLTATTVLSIYKPWGMRRREAPRAARSSEASIPSQMPVGVRIVMGIIGLILAIVVVLHLTGHGMGGHGL